MTPAIRWYPSSPIFNVTTGFVRAHERVSELMWSLVAAKAFAHVHTPVHQLPSLRLAEFVTNRSFAAMAYTGSDILQHQQETQHQTEGQARRGSALYQPLHQGVTIVPASSQRCSTGFKKTFYKRKLPCPPAIEFSSPEGRQLFMDALRDGFMVGFFKLMEQFNTQDEPAFCGLASLAMVLNALSIDPRRTWKGSWRWFHEAMLDCCRPLDIVKQEGITLYQASCLARCNGARVELRPYGSTTLEQFRSEVQSVCRSGEEHIVVSYSRKAFLQTGDGHFSPIGGYHSERDLVLVLDVARFKYPPHWVPLPMLYNAMSYLDPETDRPRGYMRLASNPLLDSVLLTLDLGSDGWRPADRFVRMEAPALVEALATQGGVTGEDVVRRVVDAMPLASLDYFLIIRSGAPLPCAALSDSLVAAAAAVAASSPSLALSSNVTAVALVADTAVGTTRTAQPAPQPASPLRSESTSAPSPVKTSCSGGGGGAAAAKSSCGGSCGSSIDGGPGSSSKGSLMAAAAAVFTAQDRCIPLAQRQQLLDELRGMPLYTLVSNHLTAATSHGAVQPSQLSSEYLAEKVAMALLMQRPDAWPEVNRWRDPEAGRQWQALLGTATFSVVEAEAAYLREQLQHIDEVLQSGDTHVTCGEHRSRLDCAAHGH
ncbi:hypothetical protein Vretimale_5299 [Volvox reticuliferus]|uniref:glutathione gamma-glutamylcysteinyltransferase n=1 Tax=Volvox reticuliferus TaxID=1737510 RepID=A0A8J4G5L2_9CHLO|nr:hypothetical protein Vretifemale_5501 [Volvox reticuliferus]GIM00499.1 hypothetical protein Vretimale_5299 [Volvox reticuliferus]